MLAAVTAPLPKSCESARRASAAERIDAILLRMTLMDSGKSDSGVYGPSDSMLTAREKRDVVRETVACTCKESKKTYR